MTKKTNEIDILGLIDGFLSGQDISVARANVLELALDDSFPEDETVQDLVLMLASYCPGGGEFLYDERAIAPKLCNVRERLLHSKAKQS